MYTARTFLYAVLSLVIVMAYAGCDSNDDEEDNVFVGSWELTTISTTEQGDLTPIFFMAVESLTADFQEETYVLDLDYREEANNSDVSFTGPYTFTDTQIRLTVTALNVTLPLNYNVVTNDRIELSGPAPIINSIFQTDLYQGTVTITIERR